MLTMLTFFHTALLFVLYILCCFTKYNHSWYVGCFLSVTSSVDHLLFEKK